MKKLFLLVIFSSSIFNAQLSIMKAQTWKEMIDSTNKYLDKLDFPKAEKYLEVALVQAEKEFGKLDSNFAITLVTKAALFSYLAQQDSAIYYEEQALGIYRQILPDDSELLARSINDLAIYYSNVGRYDDAEKLYLESLSIRRKIYKHDHPDLATSINSTAAFYFNSGKLKEAESMFIESLEMRRRIYKSDHPDLARSINNMAYFFESTGKFSEAENLYKEALGMYKRLFKADHKELALIINNIGAFFQNMGNYVEAERYYLEAFDMRKRLFNGNHPEIALSLNNIATCYSNTGRYAEAEEYYLKALDMNRAIYKNDHTELAKSINNLAYFYESIGNYFKAESLFKEAIDINSRIFKGDHQDLATNLNNLASLYMTTGRYSEAEPILTKTLNMRRRLFTDHHPDISLSINNLAYLYEKTNDLIKAEALYKEALDINEKIFQLNHPVVAINMNNLASLYNKMNRKNDAELLYTKALEIFQEYNKSNSPDLVMSLNNLGLFYLGSGDYTKSKEYFSKALSMAREMYKSNNPELAKIIMNVASYYNSIGFNLVAKELFAEAINIYRQLATNYFPVLTEKEKRQFWNTMKHYFELFYAFVFSNSKIYPELLTTVYDLQLETKAILFNSNEKLRNRIKISNDSCLVESYQKWVDMKKLLADLCWMSEKDRMRKGFNLDSLETEINSYERYLNLHSQDFAQSYEYKKIDWRTVRTFLKPDEAAVEVLRINPVINKKYGDSIIYIFLIVNDDTPGYPDFIILNNGKEMENQYLMDYRNYIKNKVVETISFDRYWGPIFDKLKKYKKIYFSAEGVYNKINPLTFMLKDSSYLLEKQDIQLLSSTRDIVQDYYKSKQESSIVNNAILVGNPNFYLSEKDAEKITYQLQHDADHIIDANPFQITRGIELTMLPETEKEILEIEKFLISKKWDVKKFLGDMALKATVKNARNPRVLHISTHGIFLDNSKSNIDNIFGFEDKRVNDNPLFRSGLFFAGSNSYLKSGTSKNNYLDTGILTAYEAMNLDLDNTELVVLSACETGLGEVESGEGVFGLRRAFQQAGAKTVIMSLWDVIDQTTCELMIDFYKYWTSGMTKRAAFKKAQLDIKTGYQYPLYWGAFVMVGE